jgi:ribonuclease PH
MARRLDELRPVQIRKNVAPHAAGSVLISAGKTRVICAVTIEESIPRWMKDQGVAGGWLTAEYSMLPYSTTTRKQRDITRGKLDGRSQEIQRLIGRSLRAAVDLEKIGERTMWVDCDVLQADGGTRTTAITGAYLAVALAVQKLLKAKKIKEQPLKSQVAAVSVGIVDGRPTLDLDYEKDVRASVDMNVVMNGEGDFIEVQASGEEATFSQAQLDKLLKLARKGINQLMQIQRKVIGKS